ncbi:MAG: DUF5667 domain-containing protein, partial [Chloroflexota bacterium]
MSGAAAESEAIDGGFEDALDEAIDRLRAGEALDECLAAYPEFAQDLRPLLEMAVTALEVAPAAAPLGAKTRVRANVLAQAQARLARRPWWGWLLDGLRPGGLAAAAASALLLLGGGGAVVASAGALPGEPLYPVKLAVEDARVVVVRAAAAPEARVELQTELARRRLEEVQAIVEQGRPVPPAAVEAAARHVAAAEEVAAQAPAPQRPMLAAKVAEAETQVTTTLAQ